MPQRFLFWHHFFKLFVFGASFSTKLDIFVRIQYLGSIFSLLFFFFLLLFKISLRLFTDKFLKNLWISPKEGPWLHIFLGLFQFFSDKLFYATRHFLRRLLIAILMLERFIRSISIKDIFRNIVLILVFFIYY